MARSGVEAVFFFLLEIVPACPGRVSRQKQHNNTMLFETEVMASSMRNRCRSSFDIAGGGENKREQSLVVETRNPDKIVLEGAAFHVKP